MYGNIDKLNEERNKMMQAYWDNKKKTDPKGYELERLAILVAMFGDACINYGCYKTLMKTKDVDSFYMKLCREESERLQQKLLEEINQLLESKG